jgi:hypothetical protein
MEKTNTDDGKNDIYWVLFFVLLIMVVWYFSGGPSRPAAKQGPFIESPVGKYSESLKKSSGVNDSEKKSLYGAEANLTAGRAAKNSDPQEEYLEIKTSTKNSNPLNITGWVLKSESGKEITIGKGTSLPYLGQINQQENILLEPGEKALITTGKSPIGISFRLNKCIGYFSQFQDFYPKLPNKCPHPIKDEMLPSSLDNTCVDYINKNFKICLTCITLPFGLSNSCKEYINERINYNGCVSWHKKDTDFYNPEWRIYLSQEKEMWNNDLEKIILYNQNGEIVDWTAY